MAKCYIFVCAGCGYLEESERSDKLTCSGACRVRAHRSGYLKELRDIAKMMEISPAFVLQVQAVQKLRPDLYSEMAAGKLQMEDVREDVRKAFIELLCAAINAAT